MAKKRDLGGGGDWGQGLEGFVFLMGLGREVAEPEQLSGIAVALTVSTKKIGLGKGSRGGECTRQGRALGCW